MDGIKIERRKMYRLPAEHTGAAIARRVGALKDDNTIRPKINIKNQDEE